VSFLILNQLEEKFTMKTIEKLFTLFLPILLLVMLPLIAAHPPAFAENPELSSVLFYVQ
jgi:hypothetical protein